MSPPPEGTLVLPDEIFCTVFECVKDYLARFANCLPHLLLGGAATNLSDPDPERPGSKKVLESFDYVKHMLKSP